MAATPRRQHLKIGATCPTHGGVLDMATLSVTRLPDGSLELDPHSHGRCGLRIGPAGAQSLGAWLARA